MDKLQSKENEVVLSYHNSILRRRDVNLLNGSFWLNDAIIGFYFEYLEQKYQKSNSKLLFIGPEVTQLLKLTDSKDYSIFLDPIVEANKEAEFIFFPVNDCNSRKAAGGTHWILMVFSKHEKKCFNFDSSSGSSESFVKDFSREIMRYFLREECGQFISVDCPQQDNGHDCGLYVLCFTDIIAEHVLKTSKVEGCKCDNVKKLVSEKRKSLLTLISTLKESKT